MATQQAMEPKARLKELNLKANNFSFDMKIPARMYLRSTNEMERMALVYANENEYESAFLLYMKMISLLVEKLPKHHDYKNLTPEQKQLAKKRCVSGVTAAEKLKKALQTQFQKQYDAWQKSEKQKLEREEAERQRLIDEKKKQEKEQTNKALSQSAYPVIFSNQAVDQKAHDGVEPTTFDAYPSVPNVTTSGNERVQPSAPPPSFPSSQELPPPYIAQEPHTNDSQIPPSTHLPLSSQSQLPPSYDDIASVNRIPHVDRASKPNEIVTPAVDRQSKPDDLLRQDSTILDGNRKILIASNLVPNFLQLASANTRQNLETCGILTGKLSRNTLRITHLVIPKQSATPDSCTTESEEELFDVQDNHDLITLGWIHTHPSQTSFLSSVDLHTQCSYQQLMPEAIAIVCAPKYNTTGIYRLTPDHGLNFITSCSKSGFHPHPQNPPLFEDSPLVSIDGSYSIEIIDLRKK